MKKDILIYFIGKTIPAMVNLAIIVLGVRFLGGEQYGRYSLIMSGTVLIGSFTFTWIQQSMIRFLSAFKEDPTETLSRFFYMTLVSILAGIPILVLVSVFYFKLGLTETLTVTFYTIMSILFLFRLTIYQTLLRPLKYTVYEGIYNIFLLIFFLGFIYILVYRSFMILFISMGAGLIIAEIFHVLTISEKKLRFDVRKFHWKKEFTRKMMDYGFTLTIWLVIMTMITMADRYIIKEYQDYAALGTYSAIKDLVTKISTFAVLPLMLAFNAKINDSWNTGKEEKAIKLVRQVVKLQFLVFLVVMGGFILFRNLLFTRILHLKGEGLFFTSIFLIAGAFLWQGALMLQKPLEMLMKQRTMVIALLSALLVNIAGNLFFVSLYGFAASAVISFVTGLLYVILVVFLSSRNLEKHRMKRSMPDGSGPGLVPQQ